LAGAAGPEKIALGVARPDAAHASPAKARLQATMRPLALIASRTRTGSVLLVSTANIARDG